MLNRHPPLHTDSHARTCAHSRALSVTPCASLLIVNPAERNFIFMLSHHPLLINVNQCLLHSTHCKYTWPYLCRGGVAKISTVAKTNWALRDGFSLEEPGDARPSWGVTKMLWLLGGCCWSVSLPSPDRNRKQFSGWEEPLQPSRGARGSRDLPVHLDSCQEQWQQWAGQQGNSAGNFSGACISGHAV